MCFIKLIGTGAKEGWRIWEASGIGNLGVEGWMAEVADGSAMNSAVSVIPTLSSQVRRLTGASQVLWPVPGVLNGLSRMEPLSVALKGHSWGELKPGWHRVWHSVSGMWRNQWVRLVGLRLASFVLSCHFCSFLGSPTIILPKHKGMAEKKIFIREGRERRQGPLAPKA